MLKVRYWIQPEGKLDTIKDMVEIYHYIWYDEIHTPGKNRQKAFLPLPGLTTSVVIWNARITQQVKEVKTARILYRGIKELPLAVIERPLECTLVSLSQCSSTERLNSAKERTTPLHFRVVWSQDPSLTHPFFRNVLDPKWKPRLGRPREEALEGYTLKRD